MESDDPLCLVKFLSGVNEQMKKVLKCVSETNLQVDNNPIGNNETSNAEESFQCSTCRRQFTKKSHYKYHIKSHWVRSHHCSICRKSFLTKQALSVHQVVHTAVAKRPFRCHHCSKTFQTKQNLTNHENIHLGIKPFHCETCSKSFSEKSSLKKHLAIHTKEKQYSCSFCDKKFSQIGSRQRHLAKFHNDVSSFGGFLPSLGAEIVANELKLLETIP